MALDWIIKRLWPQCVQCINESTKVFQKCYHIIHNTGTAVIVLWCLSICSIIYVHQFSLDPVLEPALAATAIAGKEPWRYCMQQHHKKEFLAF